MAVAVGYNGTVDSWAAPGGSYISNAAILALMTYNEHELTIVAAELDTSQFRAVGASGPRVGVYECMNGLRSWDGSIRGQNATPVPGHVALVAADSHSFYDYNPFAWDMTIRMKELDTTAMSGGLASAPWATFVPGQLSWGGSMSFWADDTNVVTVPNLYTASLYPTFTISSGNTLGNGTTSRAHITNVRIGTRVDDRIPVTLTYMGTGDLVVAGSANIMPAATTLTPSAFTSSTLTLKTFDGSGTDKQFSGSAFIRAMRVAAQVDQKTTVDIEFRGTGVLTPA